MFRFTVNIINAVKTAEAVSVRRFSLTLPESSSPYIDELDIVKPKQIVTPFVKNNYAKVCDHFGIDGITMNELSMIHEAFPSASLHSIFDFAAHTIKKIDDGGVSVESAMINPYNQDTFECYRVISRIIEKRKNSLIN